MKKSYKTGRCEDPPTQTSGASTSKTYWGYGLTKSVMICGLAAERVKLGVGTVRIA